MREATEDQKRRHLEMLHTLGQIRAEHSRRAAIRRRMRQTAEERSRLLDPHPEFDRGDHAGPPRPRPSGPPVLRVVEGGDDGGS